MRLKSLILLPLFLLPAMWLQAQPDAKASKRNGDAYFENERYNMALMFYLSYADQVPEDPTVRERIGICYYHNNQTDLARQYLLPLVERSKSPQPEAVYYYAKTLHSRSEFAEAALQYKEYLRLISGDHPRRSTVKDELRRCAHGLRKQGERQVHIVENLGQQVNSSGDDFKPILSPNNSNRIYFASAREGVVGGRRTSDGREDPDFGRHNADIFFTNLQSGVWGAAETMSFLLNSPRHDVVLDFTNSGKHMYYFRGTNLYSGEILVDTFKARIQDRHLNPGLLEFPMRPWEGDCEPHFMNDSTLIFASRRTGGFGGLDLYVSVRNSDKWSEPENLGPTVNSVYDETSPFIGLDGRTLYFSSNHAARSIGGLDVFRTVYNDQTESWTPPMNLGTPINSPDDDLHYRISHDGMRAYFASSRKDGYGGKDIYVIYFREFQQEQGKLSVPPLFAEVPAYKKLQTDPDLEPTNFDQAEIQTLELDPLYYEENGDLLTPRNIRGLNELAKLLQDYPSLELILTSNSDGTDPPDFDLFFAIKRAETMTEHLIKQGVDPTRIKLKSLGSAYPAAASTINGQVNTAARRLNRRIDVQLINNAKLPVALKVNEPSITDGIALPEQQQYRRRIKGVSYKVQVAASQQMFNDPIMRSYSDLMIEKDAESGFYKYTFGLYNTFQSASQLRNELGRDFPGAFVVAYIDGQRISKREAEQYVQAYPDLAGFVNQ